MSRHAKATSKTQPRRRPDPRSKLTRVVRKAANRVRRLSAAIGRVGKRAVRTMGRSLRKLKPQLRFDSEVVTEPRNPTCPRTSGTLSMRGETAVNSR